MATTSAAGLVVEGLFDQIGRAGFNLGGSNLGVTGH
jgi:hypothetical protein